MDTKVAAHVQLRNKFNTGLLGIVSKLGLYYSASLSKLSNFYLPRYHQKTKGFLMVLGSIEARMLESLAGCLTKLYASDLY